jgi:hypothetical protein
METNAQNNVEGYFNSLKIIHIAMVAGLGFFCAIGFFLVSTNQFPPSIGDSKVLQLIGVVIALCGIAGSYFVFKNMLGTMRALGSTDEKLNRYRNACIIKYALLEGPALVNIVLYMLTGNVLYLGISGLIIICFGMLGPGRECAIT